MVLVRHGNGNKLPKVNLGWNQVLEWDGTITLDLCFQLDASNGCAPREVRRAAKTIELHLKVGS